MRIFLLGANGFIGRHIASHLQCHGHQVVASARNTSALARMGFATFQADIGTPVNWAEGLYGCDMVIMPRACSAGRRRRCARCIARPPPRFTRLPKRRACAKLF